ncbi:hypothetical protein D3C76_429070 [compost metagenome]
MIEHNVNHNLDAFVMCFLDQFLEGRHVAKMLIELRKVFSPIAVISVLFIATTLIKINIIYDWRNPKRVNTEFLQVI